MIHPTAVIDPKAELDTDVTVGAQAVIDGPVRVGAGTRIYPGAYLAGHTTVGRACEIHPSAVVGAVPQDLGYKGERTFCVIGDHTVIREHASVHRGTEEGTSTVLGQHCYLMAGAHVGHNCQVGDRVKIANHSLLGGHVVVGDDTFMSALSGIHQFVRVGPLVMISGLTRVTMDVPPCFTVVGNTVCVSVNVVGMRRAGCTADEIADARRAYRTLYRNRTPFRQAIEQLGETCTTDLGRRIYDFVREPSPRGYAPGPRARIEN